MRRHGALRALKDIDEVPAILVTFLRTVTFFVPRRVNVQEDNGMRLAAALAEMGPAYIKLGQTLAMRPDIVGFDIAGGLSSLQDRLKPFSSKAAIATIEREFNQRVEDIFDDFNPVPVAAASIAQVHKATTKDGKSVAVKILRPDIRKRFARDLSTFHWMANQAEAASGEARRLRLREVVKTVEKSVHDEMDLRLEARAAKRLAKNMEGATGYRVPKIYDSMTTRRVMTLEWIDGIRVSNKDALVAAGIDLPELAERIVQTFLVQAMRDGYFHADLHQGNLLIQPDGGIVAIDFGIMGRLDKRSRRFLAEILYGFIQRDFDHVAQVHFDAGYVPRHHSLAEFSDALRDITEPIMDLPVNEISAGELLMQLFATTARFDMQTRPELILLQRSMVMAEGMALHLYPQAIMWHYSEPVLKDWIIENLSPEIQLADAIRNLPKLITHLLDEMENGPRDAGMPAADPVTTPRGGTLPFIAGAIFMLALAAIFG